MANDWTRRRLLIGSLLVLGGCTRYGSTSSTQYSRANQPVLPTPPQRPIAGPIAPQPEPPAPLPEPDIPAPVPGRYILVSRDAWTKRPIGSNNYAMNGVSRITVHHTGEYEAWADKSDLDVVRSIDNAHRSRGWPTIGYHYLVGKDGRIYEGRPVQYQGAHTYTENEHNLGISVIGDFREKLPNSAQLAALARFLDDQRKRFRVSLSRVYGHRDLHKSICPGNALYAWLKKYKVG